MATFMDAALERLYPSQETIEKQQMFKLVEEDSRLERSLKILKVHPALLSLIDGSTGLLHTDMGRVSAQAEAYIDNFKQWDGYDVDKLLRLARAQVEQERIRNKKKQKKLKKQRKAAQQSN